MKEWRAVKNVEDWFCRGLADELRRPGWSRQRDGVEVDGESKTKRGAVWMDV